MNFLANTKTIDTNGRVSITNLRAYNLHFRAIESERDIKIPANAKAYRHLTFNEVDSQVKSGNPFFTGDDSKGNNACIVIDDVDVRNYMFGVTDTKEASTINSWVLNADSVRDLLKITNAKKLTEELKKYVIDEGDKQTLITLSEDLISGATVAQKTAIEKITGYKFNPKKEEGIE